MGFRGLLAVSYPWQNPVYHSKVLDQKNPYGRVYKDVLERMLDRGWQVEQHFPLRELLGSMGDYRSFNDRLAGFAQKLISSEPDLVLHDPDTFLHHLHQGIRDIGKRVVTKRYALGELHSSLRGLCGKVERIYSTENDWEEESSNKDTCYKVAKKLGIPTPQTILLSETKEANLTFEYLARVLDYQKEFLLKLIPSSEGKGVFKISSQKDLDRVMDESDHDLDQYLAQRKIALPGKHPYSIRVVMWGDVVLGAVLLINFNHEYCSNSHKGGFALDLAVNGSMPRNSMSSFYMLDREKRHELAAVAQWLGIDLERRMLPEPAERYSRLLGSVDSNALLRGNDFMRDEHGNFVILESNFHPGPPGTGMFSNLMGFDWKDELKETKIAVDLIVPAIEKRKRRH